MGGVIVGGYVGSVTNHAVGSTSGNETPATAIGKKLQKVSSQPNVADKTSSSSGVGSDSGRHGTPLICETSIEASGFRFRPLSPSPAPAASAAENTSEHSENTASNEGFAGVEESTAHQKTMAAGKRFIERQIAKAAAAVSPPKPTAASQLVSQLASRIASHVVSEALAQSPQSMVPGASASGDASRHTGSAVPKEASTDAEASTAPQEVMAKRNAKAAAAPSARKAFLKKGDGLKNRPLRSSNAQSQNPKPVSAKPLQREHPAVVQKESSRLSPNPRKNLAPPTRGLWPASAVEAPVPEPKILPRNERAAGLVTPRTSFQLGDGTSPEPATATVKPLVSSAPAALTNFSGRLRAAGKSSNPAASQAASHARQRSDLQLPSDWQNFLRSSEKKESLEPSGKKRLEKGDGEKKRTAGIRALHKKQMKMIDSGREKQTRMDDLIAKKTAALRSKALANPNPELQKLASNPQRDSGLPRLNELMPSTEPVQAFFVPLHTPANRLRKEMGLPGVAAMPTAAPFVSAKVQSNNAEAEPKPESRKSSSPDSGIGGEIESQGFSFRRAQSNLKSSPQSPTSTASPYIPGAVSDSGSDLAMKDRPSPLGGEVFHTGNRRLSQSSTGTASSIASNLEAEFKAEAEPGSWEQVGKELGFFRERPVKVQAGKASAAKNPAAASGKPAPAVRWVISDGRWQKASDVAELAAKQAQTASTASNRPAANVVKTLTPVPQPVQERHVIYRSDPPPAEKKAVRPFAETFEEARPKRVSRLIDFWENHGALITPLPAPSKDR